MHTVPSGTLAFIFEGLGATPDVLRLIVHQYPDGPAWDIRKDPERFTAREALAHLADWEQVFTRRVRSTIAGAITLENPDLWLLREARHYSGIEVESSVNEFTDLRSSNLMRWRELSDSELQATSNHPNRGPMSVEVQLIHAYAHDGYHINQLLNLLS